MQLNLLLNDNDVFNYGLIIYILTILKQTHEVGSTSSFYRGGNLSLKVGMLPA